MADYVVSETDLKNIANAIRSKTQSTEGMTVKEMKDNINSIQTGTNFGYKCLNIPNNPIIFTDFPTGYDFYFIRIYGASRLDLVCTNDVQYYYDSDIKKLCVSDSSIIVKRYEINNNGYCIRKCVYAAEDHGDWNVTNLLWISESVPIGSLESTEMLDSPYSMINI